VNAFTQKHGLSVRVDGSMTMSTFFLITVKTKVEWHLIWYLLSLFLDFDLAGENICLN